MPLSATDTMACCLYCGGMWGNCSCYRADREGRQRSIERYRRMLSRRVQPTGPLGKRRRERLRDGTVRIAPRLNAAMSMRHYAGA